MVIICPCYFFSDHKVVYFSSFWSHLMNLTLKFSSSCIWMSVENWSGIKTKSDQSDSANFNWKLIWSALNQSRCGSTTKWDISQSTCSWTTKSLINLFLQQSCVQTRILGFASFVCNTVTAPQNSYLSARYHFLPMNLVEKMLMQTMSWI